MRISYWSSGVCSSDLMLNGTRRRRYSLRRETEVAGSTPARGGRLTDDRQRHVPGLRCDGPPPDSGARLVGGGEAGSRAVVERPCAGGGRGCRVPQLSRVLPRHRRVRDPVRTGGLHGDGRCRARAAPRSTEERWVGKGGVTTG